MKIGALRRLNSFSVKRLPPVANLPSAALIDMHPKASWRQICESTDHWYGVDLPVDGSICHAVSRGGMRSLKPAPSTQYNSSGNTPAGNGLNVDADGRPTLHTGARRLKREAEQQKYSEIATLVSVTVGREQFWNAKPRFTQPGPAADLRAVASTECVRPFRNKFQVAPATT